MILGATDEYTDGVTLGYPLGDTVADSSPAAMQDMLQTATHLQPLDNLGCSPCISKWAACIGASKTVGSDAAYARRWRRDVEDRAMEPLQRDKIVLAGRPEPVRSDRCCPCYIDAALHQSAALIA